MFPIAQTPLQLYGQLRAAGCSPVGLSLVRRAYGLATIHYSGYFQADGKPFVCHVVGVASIVASLGLPAEIIAAACIHNIYGNGDFGDARRYCASPRRRGIVRAELGPAVENAVFRFAQQRLTRARLAQIARDPSRLDTLERQLAILDLADLLELFVDDGVHHFGDKAWVLARVTADGDRLIETARLLGYPQLAQALREVFARSGSITIPPELRSAPDWRFLRLLVPPSCAMRAGVRARRAGDALVRRMRSMLYRLRFTRGPDARAAHSEGTADE